MSDILSFIIKNYSQLRLTDYLVLAVFGVLVAGTLFFVLRWLFTSRFQAQKELLDLQAQTVNTLSTHLDLTRRERDELRNHLQEKMQKLAEMESRNSTSSAIEKAATREEALVLVSQCLSAYLIRVGLVYRTLYMYKTVFTNEVPADAVSLLDNFETRVNAIYELYMKTVGQAKRESLEELASLAYAEDTFGIAKKVFERFFEMNDEIELKLKPSQKKS